MTGAHSTVALAEPSQTLATDAGGTTMFIQVLQGKVTDPSAIKAQMDEWASQLGPSAGGWLGSTAGVTADGEFIAVVRFSDPEAAQTNSDRAEQGDWWERTSRLFDGEVVFHDYPETALMLGGGSDDAGFVQIIQGIYIGEDTPGEMAEGEDELAARRPDVLGATLAWNDSGHFTQTVYFTSEEEARRGEKAMMEDPDALRRLEEMMSAADGVRFLDLPDPWMVSP